MEQDNPEASAAKPQKTVTKPAKASAGTIIGLSVLVASMGKQGVYPQKYLEATTGFEPVIKALQASALPLGHVAMSCLIGSAVSRHLGLRKRTGRAGSTD